MPRGFDDKSKSGSGASVKVVTTLPPLTVATDYGPRPATPRPLFNSGGNPYVFYGDRSKFDENMHLRPDVFAPKNT
jgi:hypothetical protein